MNGITAMATLVIDTTDELEIILKDFYAALPSTLTNAQVGDVYTSVAQLIRGLHDTGIMARELIEITSSMPDIQRKKRHGEAHFYENENEYAGPGVSNYYCSECHRVVATWLKGLKPSQMYSYCPWCGVKMKMEDSNGSGE